MNNTIRPSGQLTDEVHLTADQVSVIIPALNESSGIVAAIESARAAGAVEIIVVDGGSTDDTVTVCRHAGVVVAETDTGRAVQQNYGGRIANGQVLLFLHADCRLHADSLRGLCDWMNRSPRHIAGGFTQRIEDRQFKYRLVEAGNAMRIRLLGWIYGDQGLFVRRSVFDEVGGFPVLRLMEDLFLSRVLRTKGRLGLINRRLTVSARRWQARGVVQIGRAHV